MKIENFQRLFYPKSVAVIGATKNPKKMGFHALSSLVKTFKGKIYAVNPNYDEILGVRAYKSIKDLPETPDLAILAVPRDAIYDSVKELLEIGCRAFVIISAGFREAEIADGEELHKRLRELVESYNAVVIGPNTFGMVNLKADLNASFTPALSFLKKGDIALVSQSGGVCHLIAPYSMREGIGFSKIVGLGNRLNVDFYDMLEYLKDDKET
ncbi:CoA-binding protein, partial [Ferroglobus sp.]|uniref:CoA-binding protein n=1 Tax=Ferroglobus sp. TaxID=2614230 RepID=UPI0025BA0EA9